MSDFSITEYVSNGVETIVKNAVKATLSNPAESIFMAKFAIASKLASKKRAKAEENGEHIPAFLIASITSSCNLHCAGCYSRANHACSDSAPVCQLSADDWKKIFIEAEEIGVSFILLAGGEPMIRRDVITTASEFGNILFPIFTNGTMIDENYMNLFQKNRNLLPVISIEGEAETTDNRRGNGTYEKIVSSMNNMKKNGILFGASITVTTKNLEEVYSDSFIESLIEKGCKAVFYVEYVPVSEESSYLAPENEHREIAERKLLRIREKYSEMVFISFPGDEKKSGGCVAAGRGFFHINSHGGAEPCPFSPYSDINVKDTSLREALKSELFRKLQENGTLNEEHKGGCILFEKRNEVEKYLK
ncbi:MAG: radical SAM protein [Oscillospiraceae bacterium]|nr:radical SAM protein [Oscillospiraceae bacterium]